MSNMADPTKVYGGGIPGTFTQEQSNTAYVKSGEAETSTVPGQADATRPRTVNQGGTTQGKTHNKSASEDFLLDSNYKTNMEVASRPTNGKTVNPNDISHEDHC